MKIALTAALVGLVFPSIAFAQDPHSGKHPHGEYGMALFGKMDSNGDAILTEDELRAHHRKMIAPLDADGDGLLTKDEATAAGHEDSYAAHGTAGDKGHLTFEDTFAVEKARFEDADTDKDGGVTAEEFKAQYTRKFTETNASPAE